MSDQIDAVYGALSPYLGYARDHWPAVARELVCNDRTKATRMDANLAGMLLTKAAERGTLWLPCQRVPVEYSDAVTRMREAGNIEIADGRISLTEPMLLLIAAHTSRIMGGKAPDRPQERNSAAALSTMTPAGHA